MAITEDKRYYSITEVCDFLMLAPNTLRKWERTYELLNPKRHRATGKRMYRTKDIQLLENIQTLSQNRNWPNETVFKAIEIWHTLIKAPSTTLFLEAVKHDFILPSNLEELISRCPDYIYAETNDGLTALDLSIQNSSYAIILGLLRLSAPVHNTDLFSRSPIEFALNLPRADKKIRYFMAGLLFTKVSDYTLLKDLSLHKNHDRLFFSQLIDQLSKPWTLSNRNVFHLSSRELFDGLSGSPWRKREVYHHLLSRRKPVNRTDSQGNTPLHIAIRVAYLPNIIALLDLKPPPDPRNKQGETPLDIAVKSSFPLYNNYQSMFIAGLLIGYGAYHHDFTFLQSKRSRKD